MIGTPNLDVGRYGVFIWPAYGVSALVLAAMALDSVRRAARWRKAAERDRPEPPAADER